MQHISLTPEQVQARLNGLVALAQSLSGLSVRQLALKAGINKDTLSRCLKDNRPYEVSTLLSLVAAAGLPPVTCLTLALTLDPDDLDGWLSSGAVAFLDTLMASVPGAVAVELGDNLAELKSKWGIGAARLVGKRLADHVAENEARDRNLALVTL
jgi:lambda repressor-like predicted transcriptional regulator